MAPPTSSPPALADVAIGLSVTREIDFKPRGKADS
jgi:hypothetical protein